MSEKVPLWQLHNITVWIPLIAIFLSGVGVYYHEKERIAVLETTVQFNQVGLIDTRAQLRDTQAALEQATLDIRTLQIKLHIENVQGVATESGRTVK